ncbi:MAG: HPr-rel-A system PqqD family peptide chaperone [Sphingomonadales bacterium]|jgi:PqqD family protein of HPr-rel-A system|nr:HPr-rel-A system PqqD family peptide chaperone [Sphingomonadales bacterium]
MAADRFAAPDSDTLRVTPLEGLTALYHRPSGQTHVVAEPVPEILTALAGAALSLDDLLAAMGLPADDGEIRAGLSGHLSALQASGLVWVA